MFLERIQIALGLLAFIGVAHADSDRGPRCTNASLRGHYVFTARGTTFPALMLPPLLTGPFASAGTADFDGNGHFSLTATSSFNGLVQGPAGITGTYNVNSDCSYTSQGSNGATFRAVIVSGGKELLILQTNNGVVIAGTARRSGGSDSDSEDSPPRCTVASVAGSCGFLAEGYAGAPTIPGAPFSPLDGVGTVTLNPNGTFTMLAQRSFAGTLDPQPLMLTGKFVQAGGCNFKLTFDVGFHFDATVVSNNETVFIETDPGTAVLVRSKRL